MIVGPHSRRVLFVLVEVIEHPDGLPDVGWLYLPITIALSHRVSVLSGIALRVTRET